jgi:hypothetical protein
MTDDDEVKAVEHVDDNGRRALKATETRLLRQPMATGVLLGLINEFLQQHICCVTLALRRKLLKGEMTTAQKNMKFRTCCQSVTLAVLNDMR